MGLFMGKIGNFINSLNPRYDIANKQIKNAKEDTFVYYHEERHAWQDEIGLLTMYSNVLIFFPLLILLTQEWIWAIIPLFLTIIIEMDAHVFAFRKWLKKRKMKTSNEITIQEVGKLKKLLRQMRNDG